MGNSAFRILIVDDEPPLLKMMGMYLTRRGYSVTASGTTEAAWAELEAARFRFDVVVLDASMPGIGMEELAFRMLAANPRLCLLATSGYPVDMTAIENVAAGRACFLHKPFTGEMLGAAIRRMLAAQEESL
jgi:two-component system response regulator GlrR